MAAEHLIQCANALKAYEKKVNRKLTWKEAAAFTAGFVASVKAQNEAPTFPLLESINEALGDDD